MNQVSDLRHWRLDLEADGIAWCTLDVQGESANVLSTGVLTELRGLVDYLEQSPLKGVVIRSGKESGFIAGADVREFTQVTDSAAAASVIRQVHELFNRLERLNCPTLALIHGYCLGGGLELALACRWRIAVDDPATRIGFPEVMLGIFPGFGGSMRSVRTIGPLQALQLMLTGRNLDARRAARLGLVDRVVPERQAEAAARALLLGRQPKRRRSVLHRIAALSPSRRLLAAVMRRQLRKRANPAHYPAPYELVEHWERNGGSERAMLDGEAERVSGLIMTSASRNLVRAYLLQERLKSLGRTDLPSVQHVHVIGAGIMGGDIAAWCVAQGLTVTLQDREPRFVAPAIGRAQRLFERRLRQSRLVTAAMDRLIPDLRGGGVTRADVVIEAIVENRDAKAALFRDIEPKLKDGAILATNTSSIALESLVADLQRPQRLVGIHFFNPVAKMQLVEIVRGASTAPEEVQRAAAFCRQIGRLPLPVRSAPGFLVNRILAPYLMEATLMLQDGVSAEAIDAAATAFGMPMGPVELADTVGLDICLSVAENLAGRLGMEIPGRLKELVAAGRLGRKSGQGWYRWRRDRPVRSGKAAAGGGGDLEQRLVLRILNECAACLREQIVDDADLLDAGMIFGTGFAPFRGGPVHYALEQGRDGIVADLTQLAERYGARFNPDPWWQSAGDPP
jgi:3-hydroxyacyl-CoA dehydrogenase/enoyl-CoA hydratase/3-hydroxybutyryl-CoA epimerase